MAFDWKKITPYLVLTAIGFILYLPSLFFGYTYLDDNALILDNLNFLTKVGNFFAAFGREVFNSLGSPAVYYRPILTISFMLNSWVAGATPFFYHLTNVLIHLIVICLIFVFLQKLKIKKELAFLGALIFAVHPVLTQAVSWIPGRNDSLLLLFVLSSFIYLINYLKSEKFGERNFLILIFHFFFFFLAIFTKESALIFIPLAIFYIYFISETKISRKGIAALSVGWTVILLFWFVLRHAALVNPIPFSFSATFWAIVSGLPAVVQFVGKIFIPLNLSVLPIMADTTFVYGIISLIFLVAFVLYSLKKEKNYWRFCLFGAVWFLGFLLISFASPDSSSVPDFIEHRLYVPIIGILIILFKSDFFEKLNFKKKLVMAVCLIVIALFCLKNLTYQQNFKDRISFWQNAAVNSPDFPLAHRNLAVMYYFDGRFDEALAQDQMTLALSPNEPMVHNNIGVILMDEGKLDEATQEFLMELEVNPNYDKAVSNLTLVYEMQNKKEEAKYYSDLLQEINSSGH